MPLIRFTILIIFGVVTSQNQDVNSQTPYRKMIRQRSVEAATAIPPDPRVDDEGIELLLTRLETLCVEKFDYLITDTNKRFQSLEHQSSEVHSTVDLIRDELGHIHDPLTRLENLLLEKLDNLTAEVGQLSQCCSGLDATSVVPINESLEVKVENLNKDIQLLMNATRISSSNAEEVQRNVSSPISDTRSIFNDELQEQTTIQTVSSTPRTLNCALQYPRNCKEVRDCGKYASGVYILQPEHAPSPFEAVCDLEVKGGNWTVIQRRYDGSQNFYLGWQDYKNGFGNLRGEFWLGLENIHLLTGYEENELLIELGMDGSQDASALYSQFCLGSEIEGYSLKSLGTFSGNAGNSLTFSIGSRFSTKDVGATDLARAHIGAWWYNNTVCSNLNGKYLLQSHGAKDGIFWYYYHNNHACLEHTRMLVRPKL